jgi:hypothetical protein
MNITEVWLNRACLDFEILPNSVDLAKKSAQNSDLVEPDFPHQNRICANCVYTNYL